MGNIKSPLVFTVGFIFYYSRAGEPDQLLADIDDMLADLNTHLDFMIPEGGGTDV